MAAIQFHNENLPSGKLLGLFKVAIVSLT